MRDRLDVGVQYEAIGPAADSKNGPPSRVTVVDVDEAAGVYRTTGRGCANVIAFGCEKYWRPAVSLELAPEPPQSWCERRMCALDLETTAPSPEQARIVTAAIALVGGSEPTHTRTWLADPGVEIPDGAADIHGITTARARAEGQPIGDVVDEVITALAARPADAPIVIFNGRYDLTVLDREARRHGIAPLVDRGPLLVVDPLVIDKHLHRYRSGSRRLDAQCAHYGAKLEDAHRADADALAAARLAWVIGRKASVVRRVRNGAEARELAELEAEWATVRHDLPALHAAQERWALAERERFAQYKRSIGDHEEAARIDAEIGWPTLEMPQRTAVAA